MHNQRPFLFANFFFDKNKGVVSSIVQYYHVSSLKGKRGLTTPLEKKEKVENCFKASPKNMVLRFLR